MDLPMNFGEDSPFPPMPSSRTTPSMRRPSAPAATSSRHPAPPLPPSRFEALQREQQIRQQQQQHPQSQFYGGQAGFSPKPGQYVVQTPPPPPHAPHFSGMPGMVPVVPVMAAPPAPLMHSPSIRHPMSPRPPPHGMYANAPMGPGPVPAPARPIAMPLPAVPAPSPSPSMPPQQPHAPPHVHHSQIMASQASLSSSFDSMRLHNNSSQASFRDGARRPSFSTNHQRESSSSSSLTDQSALSITLPDLDELCRRRDKDLHAADDRVKIAWCKDVLKYVERKLDGNRINDPSLVQLVDQAINTITRFASAKTPLAEALFLRGDLLASGSFPSYHPKDLRSAFNDFELSARMGYAASWFRIGRDYEVLGDMTRARDAYERGCSVQDVGCIYRMGMANLLGQLELGVDHGRAIPLLKEAADLSTVDTPQPSYVYGMLMAGEFNHVKVAMHLLVPDPDPQKPHLPPSRESEARRRIQRAAFLTFPPAQYRMGWLHEYAQLECQFDPLLSVQYYSLASQGGEVEADLALSKWFLCGAENCFDKNESLAFTFADKAAIKNLPSAEFAMGYFFEVGVGCEKDLDVARKWYRKAASHDNEDAKERIKALEGPEPSTLSRKQHEAHVDTQLQRKRTEAKMLSDRRVARASEYGSKVQQPPKPSPQTSMPTASTGSSSSRPVPLSSAAPVPQQQMPTPMPTPQSKDVSRRMTMRLVEEVAQRPARSSMPVPQQGMPMPVAALGPPHSNQPRPLNSKPHQMPSSSGRPDAPNAGLARAKPSQTAGMAAASPRRGSADAPLAANASRLHGNGGVSQSSGRPNQAAGGGKSIPVVSAPSMGPDSKVYETFGEMGFNSQAARDDKDCVIC